MAEWRRKISFFEHVKDSESTVTEMSLEEFYGTLEAADEADCTAAQGPNHCVGKKCPNKALMAWTPGLVPEGEARTDANVTECNVLGYDFDNITDEEFQGILADVQGVECLLHTTHNHRPNQPGEAPTMRIRVVLPLKSPVKPKLWKAFWQRVAATTEWDKLKGFDTSCHNPARLLYLSSHPCDVRPFSQRCDGELLDPKDYPAVAKGVAKPDEPVGPLATDLSLSASFDAAVTDMEGLREIVSRIHRTAAGRKWTADWRPALRALLRGDPLELEGKGKWEVRHGVARVLGCNFPNGTDPEAALALARASLRSQALDDEDDIDAKEEERCREFRQSFEKGQRETAAWREARKAKAESSKEKGKKYLEERARKSCAGGSEATDQHGDSESEEAEDDTVAFWRTLSWEEGKESGDTRDEIGTLDPKRKIDNAATILQNDPLWSGRLAFNALTKKVDYRRPPVVATQNSDAMVTRVQRWLERHYRLPLKGNEIVDVLNDVSDAAQFDPLNDYLDARRGKWDGVQRIDTFLEQYCNAQTTELNGKDVSGYVRKISRKFMLQCVARGLDPGCKADNVLVLEGLQGIGKSRLLCALGGEFFTDMPIDITNKDSLMLVARRWIVELTELETLKPDQVRSLKGFFSRRSDTFRRPYGRNDADYPRRAVFIGTTNESAYLSDPTGNRRYWTVRCGTKLQVHNLARDRDQLFAEAVAVYDAAKDCKDCHSPDRCKVHNWWASFEEIKEMDEVANLRLESEYEEPICELWSSMSSAERPADFTMGWLLDKLGIQPAQAASKRTHVGRALTKLGFRKVRGRFGTRHHIFRYYPPEEWASAPMEKAGMTRREGGPDLTAIEGGKKK